MRRLPVLLLIGALAVVGLTACMGDDDAENRRTAAIGDPAPPDPAAGGRTMSLKVALPGSVTKAAIDKSAIRGVREEYVEGAAGDGFDVGSRDCAAAVEPGRTCQWEYQLPEECPNCVVNVYLTAYPVPGAGGRVIWGGCLVLAKHWRCLKTLNNSIPDTVTAKFYD